jgi:DNA helicase-2/ATP-dependent DNA helicase PcrA
VAVLSRTKAQQREIIAALGQSSIPCHTVGEDEPHDPRAQKVAVMTMHASKGREFEVVFITGVEPGVVPLDVEGFSTDPEEERRLLYVAVTRAKKLVVLSHAARRSLFGKQLPGGPSPFLSVLPEAAIVRVTPDLRPKKPPSSQLNLF